MKTKSKISGYILRSSAAALLFSCVIVAISSAINLSNDPPRVPVPEDNIAFGMNGHESAISVAASATGRNRTLTFADRVAYQRAIEEVYWRHRIWPKANSGPKPPLDKVMSQAQIEKKVEDYLSNSQALEDYWQRPITPYQLQAEMERIARHTKQPGLLREIFAALGNDPFVIAECLARPVLAERLVTELYAHDQRFHGELKRHAEAELRTHPSVSQMTQISGMYTEMEWIKSGCDETDSAPPEIKNVQPVKMNGSEWQESVKKLAAAYGNGDPAVAGVAPAQPTRLPLQKLIAQIKTGMLSPLREDEGRYYAVAVMKKRKDQLKLATVAWLKEPLRSWVTRAETQVPMTMAAVSANYTLPVISSPLGVCTDDAWTPTTLTNAPDGRVYHTAVWTGSEMIVWGGYTGLSNFNTGGRYNPSTDSWTAIAITNAPSARNRHTAVWTGSEMIVWGGVDVFTFINTGGKYNPSTDTWTATSTTNPPTGRYSHTAVWTGREMIVWGGYTASGWLPTGGRYNPSTDTWTATSIINAPSGRVYHTAVWTGSEMIVWGGNNLSGFLNTGGRYNLSTDSWTATSTTGAPEARALHTAVWTASEMIVWGGLDVVNELNTGGRYSPMTDSWTATSTTGAPEARELPTAVWTGNETIVWGGYNGSNDLDTGGRYDPSTDTWAATSTTNAPAARAFHTAVWIGSQMIIWGGLGSGNVYLNTGARYCAQLGPTSTPTPTATASPTASFTPTPTVTATAAFTPTATPTATPTTTATATSTATPTTTPRSTPTPRPRPTPLPRPVSQ
jgi:N-acetylneuraminic acid mutarotase